MRVLTMVFVLALTAACASQPQAVDEPAAAGTSAQPQSSGGEGAAAAAAEDEDVSRALDSEVKRLASQHRVVVRDGQKLYCKRYTPLGSRLSEEICMTEDQLYQMAMRQVEAKDSYRRPKVCAGECSN